MKSTTLWLTCFLLCSCATEPVTAPSPTPSTPPTPSSPSTSTTPEATERLKVLPPEGWHRVYQFNNVTSRVVDYVPIGETSTDWNAKLTFESFTSLPDSDPVEMLAHEVLRDVDRCTFVQHFELFSGPENNYPTLVRLIMRGKNEITEKGERRKEKGERRNQDNEGNPGRAILLPD